MALAHLNGRKFQIGDTRNLAHLNDGKTLDNSLKIFLLACKVNGLSPRSIMDYAQKIGTFITFCQQLQVVPSYSYFPVETEFEELKVSENHLISKLRSIPPGKSNWHDYQKVCQEVLDYCLIPPLLEPYGELTNQAGIHRRDIVYPIPGGVMGFWGYIQSAYSATAVIVDAKNYGDGLPQNEVVIFSKYFGQRKLGNFGIIISRKGPSASAKKEQIDRWIHHKEMIVCLSDNDLEEMVCIKEESGEPEEILDKKIFEIRSSA
jgi:hypothetical protein